MIRDQIFRIRLQSSELCSGIAWLVISLFFVMTTAGQQAGAIGQESLLGISRDQEKLQQESQIAQWPDSLKQSWELKIRKSADGAPVVRRGSIWVQAEDKSILFEDQIGRLHLLKEADVLSKELLKSLAPLKEAELEKRLKEVLPGGFQVYHSPNFTFCYWTNKRYVRWVAGLYERLFRSFKNYWKNRGFKFVESDRPKIVLVFKNFAQYTTFAKAELNSQVDGMIGYYHVLNHWVVMYDLTADGRFGDRSKPISQILSDPKAVPMVATIVHEATHQMMFHSEMQVRLSGIPLWVSEGLALYFEAPDLRSRKAWTGIGKVNVLRVGPFKNYLKRRPANSLRTLIENDKRFRETNLATDAYAEAWALNYYLLKKHKKKYSSFLKELSNRFPLQVDTPEQRVKLLEKHMKMSLEELDQRMLKFFLGGSAR